VTRPERAETGDDRRPLIAPGGKVDARAVREAGEIEGDDDGPRRVRFVLSRDLNKRLDKYLRDRIPFLSRAQLQRLIESEAVTVNGRSPKSSTTLHRGDVVDVVVPPPPSSDIEPEDIPLRVLFEDEHLIVINKTPDIIVHPARSNLKGTMLHALAHHFRTTSQAGGGLSSVGREDARPGVVHRLDRATSGVIVFAKDDETHWKLGRQFEKRTVEKRYLAVVQGVVEPTADVIDLPIGPHPSNQKGLREKYVVRHDDFGKPSVTIYRARETYRNASLLEIDLRTGRTHQIRVHLSHVGYPILGDDMYGGPMPTRSELLAENRKEGEGPLITRQALHAASLAFTHPITEQRLTFQAPVPEDIEEVVRLLRTTGATEHHTAEDRLDLSIVIGAAE